MNTATQPTARLSDLANALRGAYRGISFTPEDRGAKDLELYEDMLNNDLLEIAAASEEVKEQYISRFKKFLSAYVGATSRIVSPMIAGPSNFPVRRMEKYRNWEQSASERFSNFRTKAKAGISKRIKRETEGAKTYMSEIERYTSEIEGMKANHEKMKEGNKRIKLALKNGTDITEYLTKEFGIQPHMIEWTLKFGFGLTNNNANMKRGEQRIKELKAKEQQRMEEPEKSYTFEGGEIVFNYEADRIQVKHDSRPSPDKIQELKKSGFKWSPSNQVWQRQITANAIWTTKRLFSNIQKVNL